MFLLDGPSDAPATILLAHGAGGPMDSASLTAVATALAGVGIRIARFEFGYMAARRTSGTRRPPPKAEALIPEYLDAVDALETTGRLFIGGKSMGGRVASMIADPLHSCGRIGGLLCLGYPFHPPGQPDRLRTAHLAKLRTPALIVQGTRDLFGSRDEVGSYRLSDAIDVVWLADGDHDLRPRKAVSGFTSADHMRSLATCVSDWITSRMP